jgi:DNA-binding NarL/FixJ family response regulator
MPLTILIADKNQSFRGMMRRLLRGSARVVGEAQTEAEAELLARKYWPDVILLDIDLGRDAEFSRRIRAAAPGTKVILTTSHSEEKYLSATGKSGADAFLPKRNFGSELLQLIRQLAGATAIPRPGFERRRPARPFERRPYIGPERRGSHDQGR